MAGRSKITDRRLENIGAGKLKKIIDTEVSKIIDEKHPFTLSQSDQSALEDLMALEHHERKEYFKGVCLLNMVKLSHRLAEAHKEVPIRHIPSAMKLLYDVIKDIEGEPTQRIEVKRTSSTPEDWEQILKSLPKATEATIIDGEHTTTSSNVERTDDRDQSEGQGTDQ